MKSRRYLIGAWLALLALALYVFLFQKGFLQHELGEMSYFSLYVGFAIYLLLGCLRGLTFIPSTILIALGLPFFNPLPLYILTMVGIMVSTATVYYFSRSLKVDGFFEKKYPKLLIKVQTLLKKNHLSTVIVLSISPVFPTDLLAYVSGMLRLDIKKLLLGIFIGEGLICAIYIFAGSEVIAAIEQYARGYLENYAK